MYINKYFKQLNIEPIAEIDIREKCEFANRAAMAIVDKFYDLDYLKIVDIIQHTQMYTAKIPNNLSPVNYSYLDEILYISEKIELDINNEFVLHEVIHRLQEYRNKKNKLLQLGLCDILETSIKGLALNEAAVQYIVKKVLNGENEIVEVYGMKIPTISKNYYPILTNLIEQMIFAVGENILVDSTLNSNNEFKYSAIDSMGESTYYEIQNNFDKIMDVKNQILKNENQTNVKENIDLIKRIYIETQHKILTSYFNKELKAVKDIDQLKVFGDKLFKYRNLIGSDEGQVLYDEYYKEMLNKIKEKEFSFQNRALIVVKENKIINVFKRIKNYIQNVIFQN